MTHKHEDLKLTVVRYYLDNIDTNASRNILHIVKNEIMRKGRPKYLRRTKSSISGTISVSD